MGSSAVAARRTGVAMNGHKVRKGILTFLKYFSLVFFSFCSIAPIIYCLLTAAKTNEEYATTQVTTLTKNIFNLSSYINAWSRADMGKAFLNSFIVLVFVLAISIIIGSQLAFVLSRFKFPGNGLVRGLFMVASMVPGVAMQVTVYNIMYQTGLINHLYGYIVLMCGTDVISIYIFIQFIENISISIDESAIMDGASYFRIYRTIIFPLLKPAIVTSMVLKGVNTYNEFYMSHLYLEMASPKIYTVSTCLNVFVGPMGNQYNLICAGVIISLIPALIVFILCQKQIYSGLTNGAVKG